jgi:fucose permease
MPRNPRFDAFTVSLAYLAFIGIGMSAGLLGVAWTSMQTEFAVPLDAVGFMLTASTLGYLTASFYSGMLAHRFGIGRLLTLGGALMVVGLLAAVLSPNFWLLVVLTLLSGFGSGTIDAGLNAYIAQHHSERAMNWLHAAFGVGVTVSPLILAEVFKAEQSWRMGYGIVSGFIVVLTIVLLFAIPIWRRELPQSGGKPVHRRSVRDTLRMPLVWMGILMFFVYAGLEATPGQWVFTLFTQSRGIAEVAASQWVSIYWGSFTIGRIFFGAIITRLNTLFLLRACMIGALVGALLLWWNPSAEIGFIGLAVLGFAQAPLFPVLISNTPRRVGASSAADAIGFQIAGAGVGIAALPALAGVLANNISIEIIPVFVVVAIVLMIILHELSLLQSVQTEQAEAVPAGD